MVNNTLKSGLVSRFPEFVDMLASVEPLHSEASSPKDPVVIYRDGPFRFAPATLSQPPRIGFGEADKLFGLSCIIESMRGGSWPAFVAPKSIALYKYAALVARSDANVMITSQTGIGKDGVARYIHENSAR